MIKTKYGNNLMVNRFNYIILNQKTSNIDDGICVKIGEQNIELFSSSFRWWNRSLPQISDRSDSP